MGWRFLGVGLVSAACAGPQPAAELAGIDVDAPPPNVIYILADDLGYGDPGVYGQALIDTPNLDRLAAEGMVFTQHYAGSTVCAPSRASLMAGLHTGHTVIRGKQSGTARRAASDSRQSRDARRAHAGGGLPDGGHRKMRARGA